MSGDRPATDPGAEREIDLGRWKDAILARWWLAAAGLVAGVLIGAVYGLSGGSSYNATVLIARGQAFNPSGTTTILTYLSSPAAIQSYATSPASIAYAAAKAGMSPGQLRGHIKTSTVGDTGTAAQNTNSVLVQITVQLGKGKRAEDAANAIGAYIKRVTTSNYVQQSLSIYQVRLDNYAVRLKTLQQEFDQLNSVLTKETSLPPLDRLVLISELDAAQATQGSTLDSQTTVKQEQILAQDVEQTQIVQAARADKTTARSRRNSVLFGGLIGLVAGALASLVAGLRATRVDQV